MKLYNAMEESYLKENLIHKWVTNIVRQNDGYEFLFDDEVYLPVYKYALKITKRKTVKLNLVEEKVLQIVSIGVHQVDEIAKILGITRPLLDVTLADLHVKDLISVSSDICSLLKKGEQALSNLERVEKQQDIMKDIYMDSFKGKILDDITRYQVVEDVYKRQELNGSRKVHMKSIWMFTISKRKNVRRKCMNWNRKKKI